MATTRIMSLHVGNLKQMAQTMNFLTEHNLLDYAVLEEKRRQPQNEILRSEGGGGIPQQAAPA